MTFTIKKCNLFFVGSCKSNILRNKWAHFMYGFIRIPSCSWTWRIILGITAADMQRFVTFTHNRLLVFFTWERKSINSEILVSVFSYLFCMCQLYFLGQTSQPHQLWWHCIRHKCSREHIGNLYLHTLNIVSFEAHQTHSQTRTAKKETFEIAVSKKWFGIEQSKTWQYKSFVT